MTAVVMNSEAVYLFSGEYDTVAEPFVSGFPSKALHRQNLTYATIIRISQMYENPKSVINVSPKYSLSKDSLSQGFTNNKYNV